MSERKRYLLCPQCGSRRLFITDDQGNHQYVYVYWDHTIVNAKTEEPISSDLKVVVIGCADCSWTGSVRKLVKYII